MINLLVERPLLLVFLVEPSDIRRGRSVWRSSGVGGAPSQADGGTRR